MHVNDIKLPEGVQWDDLCEHQQVHVLEEARYAYANPFLMGNTIRIKDLKCERCK